MFDFQTHFIFPTHAVPRAGPMPHGAEEITVPSGDGNTLKGVLVPPDEPQSVRTLVLGFGGNAWNGQDVAEYLHELFPDAFIAAFHYRGYAPSTGSPSADALLADAPLIHDAMVERVKADRAIAIGFSIGSGVAAHLASMRSIDGLILVTPFDSLKALAQSMYPWIPIGSFLAHEIDAGAALAESEVPVAILAAERDEIVPSERTEALRHRISNLVFDRTIARAGHNDIYARSDFQDAMRQALEALRG